MSVDSPQYRLKESMACAATWRVTFNREVRSRADRQNLLFSLAYSAQTVHPPPKLTHKWYILGMLTSPRNDSHCPKLCCLSCSLITNTSSKVQILAILAPVKPLHGNLEHFYQCIHVHTDSCLLFQSGQDQCRISGRKSALYW